MNDFFAAIELMMKHEQASGKVGITGFCYGGGVSNAQQWLIQSLELQYPFTADSLLPMMLPE